MAANATRAVIIPGGIGLARLVNLVHWEVANQVEYLDEECVAADQLVHIAAHQVVAEILGSHHPHALLQAETFASALDLYLLGKLILAGEETDFLIETIESYASYCDLYGQGPAQLESLLRRIQTSPFVSLVEAATYLFQCTETLLENNDIGQATQRLGQLARDPLYPLVHHYNIANWVLALKARQPEHKDPPPDLKRMHALLLGDESTMLRHFRVPQ